MNPYEILGISPDATKDEIKSAYRKAAKIHHPDRNNSSPESLDKFRQIQEAYEALTNPPKQQQYEYSRSPFRNHPFSWAFGDFDTQPANYDHQAYARVSLEQAYLGCELTASIEGRLVTIQVPKGIRSGQRLKIHGEGSREHKDLPPGDLYVIIEVAPHPDFSVYGIDLQKIEEISMLDLMVGCEIETQTLSGEKVKVVVPQKTNPTAKLRVQGKGMPNGNTFGDLYIAIKPVMPELSDEQLEKLKTIIS